MIASSRTGKVNIRFNDGATPVASVSGFIKKFEAIHFTESPEIQMTVDCDDPILRSLDRVEVVPTATQLVALDIADVESTAPHGFKFEVQFTGPADTFVLRDSATPEWAFTVTPGVIGAYTGFLTFDHLFFSSEYGDRYLYMVRSGVTMQLVDKVSPDSIWPILFPGDNLFDTPTPMVTWNSVSFHHAYWGV